MTVKKEPSGNTIHFWVNGKRKTLNNVYPGTMLAYYLRGIGLTGVKIGCGEGGCGSCTVMLSKYDPDGKQIEHLAVKSCLTPLLSIDRMAVTTIEGIGNTRDGLDKVQYAIAAGNGSQCGFCTPGIVMNMYSFLQNNDAPTVAQIENRFDGNLCRCTGYRAILQGMKTFSPDDKPPVHKTAKDKTGKDKTQTCYIDPAYQPKVNDGSLKIKFEPPPQPAAPLAIDMGTSKWIRPLNLAEVYKLKKEYYNGDNFHRSMLVVGHTSTGVCNNNPSIFIDISRIPELNAISQSTVKEGNQEIKGIKAGAAVPIQRLIDTLTEKSKSLTPAQSHGLTALCGMAQQIASLQIRNTGSIGGNIYLAAIFQQYYPSIKEFHPNKNTTYVSDLVTAFAALGVTVSVGSSYQKGKPAVYSMLNIPAPGKAPTSDQLPRDAVFIDFFIPYTNDRDHVRFYKIANREQDGQAYVNAGFRVRLDKKNNVQQAVIIFGGIGYNSIAAVDTQNEWINKPWDAQTLATLLPILSSELNKKVVTRPNDNNNQAHRTGLAEALFYRFFLEITQQIAPKTINPATLSGTLPLQREISHGTQAFHTDPANYPVGKPMIKNTAFMQAAGEAQYTHDLPLPPNGLVGVPVVSPHAAASFSFLYRDRKGQGQVGTVIEGLPAILDYLHKSNKFPGFVDFVTFQDVPGKDLSLAQRLANNRIGLGLDDPVFAPYVPDTTTKEAKEAHKEFSLNTVTCVGAPIGLVVAENEGAAIGAASFIANLCIEYVSPLYSYNYENEEVPVVIDMNNVIDKPGINRENLIFKQNPPTTVKAHNPLTHIPGITRPTTDPAWLNWFRDPKAKPVNGTHVVSGTQICGGQAHFYLETQSALVIPRENNRVTIHVSTQNPTGNQSAAAQVLHIAANHVDVVVTRIGGGFGGKQTRSAFVSSAAAVAAWKHNRPVKIELFRHTDTTAVGKRHPFTGQYRVAYQQQGDKKIRIKGWSTIFNSDGGNTYDQSFPVMDLALLHGDNVYATPFYHSEGYVYRTNRASNTAFRSFGTVQSLLIQENAIEQIAAQHNILPEDIRAYNFYNLKHTKNIKSAPFGQDLPYCNIKEIWDELYKSSDFKTRQQKIEKFNSRNTWKKKGISMIPLKYGISYTGPRGTLNQGYALVNAYQSDGTVLVMCGGVEMGQGLNTKMTQIAAQALGIDLKMIRIGNTDSAAVPNATATAASTGSDLNGGAVEAACKELRQRLEQFCINIEQFIPHMPKPKDHSPSAEAYYKLWQIAQNWRTDWKAHWPQIITMAYVNRVNLSAQAHYKTPHYSAVSNSQPQGRPFFYFTYSAAVSEVEIDVLTGQFNVIRSDILFDAGNSLNPCLDVGQIEGAFVQGIGYLTSENLTYNDDGVLIQNRTWNYKPPFTKNIPADFRITLKQNGKTITKDNINPANSAVKSSKGIGEPPFVLATSVFFAIKHAVIAARKSQATKTPWLQMDAPATVQRIKESCNVKPENMKI